jgi:hypothetical protein
MSQGDKSFTVSDRRHFTPDGRSRDEAEEGLASEPAGGTGTAASPTAPRVAAGSGTAGDAGPAIGGTDFSRFLIGLAAQAGALLSSEGPERSEGEDALEAARSVISILEMLREKTEGRRTEPEQALLEGLLFELRMAYVEKKRAGGR